MPLIRYRMGDRATLNRDSISCACGRGLPLTIESFEGRADDLLHTPDGRILPGVNFYTLMYSVDGIDMFKIEQSEVDRVNVQIMAGEEFGSDQHRHLTNGLRNRLGYEVDIQVSIVDAIERDESTGKIRCIESSVGE
jgi:phenylacetate-CoA ligase